MKYQEQILEAYKFLGFEPRGRQVEDINTVMCAFLDEGFKTVVLSAPTGTGKSIIGAVVAEAIHRIKNPDEYAGASFLLCPTIVLQEQYQKSFASADQLDNKFRLIKGANNFECSALSTPTEPQTAENCALRLFNKEQLHSIISEHCDSCMFSFQRKMRDKTRHLICNYSYYFIDRMAMEILGKRSVCVFDEAHLINDLFTEHNAIYFSDSRLKKMLEEINDSLTLLDAEVFKTLKRVSKDLADGVIGDSNYMQYLMDLAGAYSVITEAAQEQADRSMHDQKKYLKLSKLSKKYYGLGCKIEDLMLHNYPHAFEFKERNPKFKQEENEISVKPIFVGDMFTRLINADYNLLMSATFSKQYAERTLKLENSKYIRLAPTFPRENKKVVFYKPQNLNFNSLKMDDVVKKLQKACTEIVQHHMAKGERGIVLAPSFALTEMITQELERSTKNLRVYEHRRGEKLAEVLGRFMRHKDGPAVMLTPSGFEGLDLPGDLSRYTIVLKAPFGSLGEARMKYILKQFPDMYNIMTTMKLIQAVGRSVRGPEDWATAYFLDTNIQRLWTSAANEWNDECSTRFVSDLSALDVEN